MSGAGIPPHHLRPGVHGGATTCLDFARVGLGTSDLWLNESLRSGSKHWSGLSATEPLYRVHECVFGVLALESEPVDPRL